VICRLLPRDGALRVSVPSRAKRGAEGAKSRRSAAARGHFPTEQAALKCLYLVTRSLDPTGTGRTKWAMRWKPAINAFAIPFGDRFRPPRPTNPDAGNTNLLARQTLRPTSRDPVFCALSPTWSAG
jgi:hypothetical protein